MRRDIAVLAAFFASVSAASACPCDDSESVVQRRARATLIVQGEVVSVSRMRRDQQGMDTARIRVTRVIKGPAVRRVALLTQNTPLACGYAFVKGQTGEFLARSDAERYLTDTCLMRGTKR